MTWPQHVLGRALWLAAGAVLVWSFLHRDTASAVEAQWQAQVQSFAKYRWTVRGLEGQVVATQAGTKRVTDALRLTIARRDTAIANYQAAVRAIPQGTPGRELLVFKERCDDALAADQTALRLCGQRGDSLQRQDSLHQALYQLAASRSAKADSVIAAGLKSVQCKFLLLLPCLSRSHALELGLLAGVVGTLVLVRH